ncbi:MAG: hypothetical protein ACYC6J_02145 [Coriobacteriia bacterium]
MKWKRLTAVLVAVAVVAVAAVVFVRAESSHAREVRKTLDQIMQGIDKPSNPATALSSNPYDYIKDNPDYAALVALGFEALPALEAELAADEANGLREYVACIAIEDITNCDLKQFPDSVWDQAATFKTEWDDYLRGMPQRVSAIMSSDRPASDKAAEIRRLGAPAVPYALDAAQEQDGNSQSEVARAARAAFGDTAATGTLSDFRREHADSVRVIRDYVEDRRP